MPINILMPALSPTMEKGNLAKWLVKEGDKVTSGDVIAEIETDKATMEVEAVDEGTVAKIVVPEGSSDVPVNELIAILAAEGEDAGAAASSGGNGPAAAKAGKPAEPDKHWELPDGPETAPNDAGKKPSAPGSPAAVGEPGASMREGIHDAPPKANGKASGRVFASPLARRLARENKLELSALTGSGPHGRIVRRDIDAALKSGTGRAAPATAPAARPQAGAAAAAPQGLTDTQIRGYFTEGSYDFVPHDSMRRTIARRLTDAKMLLPHFYVTTDCRVDALLKLRADINASAPQSDGKPAYKLSVNDMVVKALAMGLKAVPEANVAFTSEGMLKHKSANVGVAVALPHGLITPILRDADQKSLSVVSNELKDLVDRARARKLKPHEYEGGASSVSNLGMYGVKDFTAIINPPQTTILAVGMGEERAVVEKGQVIVANVMSITLSCDHRAIDGALGAELLAAVKRYIEKPVSMLV